MTQSVAGVRTHAERGNEGSAGEPWPPLVPTLRIGTGVLHALRAGLAAGCDAERRGGAYAHGSVGTSLGLLRPSR